MRSMVEREARWRRNILTPPFTGMQMSPLALME